MTTTSQHTNQSILDNLHSAVLVVNADLQIEYMNPSAEMFFHISTKRAFGRLISALIIDETEFINRLHRSSQSQHPFTVYDAILKTHQETTITVDYMVSPIEYKSKEGYLLLEFISKGRLHKIEHDNTLINQNDASRSLLRGLAHEIKNPLGGLRGAAQLLERELDDDRKEYTGIIIREADRLQTLVDRMLGPKGVPNKTDINIHQVLEHVRQLVSAEKEAPAITVDYDPSLPNLIGDESMLIQAILNITRNAISAIKEADIKNGEIIFRTRSQRNCAIGTNRHALVIRVDIINNGPAIPEDIKEQIFLPMITGRADGTGLGLSIAQSLIHTHKGLIECSSTASDTCFTLLLPLEKDHE